MIDRCPLLGSYSALLNLKGVADAPEYAGLPPSHVWATDSEKGQTDTGTAQAERPPGYSWNQLPGRGRQCHGAEANDNCQLWRPSMKDDVKTAMSGVALVDFDNLRPTREKSKADLEFHASEIVDEVSNAFFDAFPDSQELDVRLYGGWTEVDGTLSRDACWLAGLLPKLRGRRRGAIVRPALATTIIEYPKLLLHGTIRPHRDRMHQKMVDGMIGADAIFMAIEGMTHIGVVTDDDDVIPATLTAYARRPEVLIWMRRRKIGSGMNDDALSTLGLRLHQIRKGS